MIRYLSIIKNNRKFDTIVNYELDSPVWCLYEKIPKTPYIKLKIKIVEKEKRYAHRGRPKRRRFLIFRKKEKIDEQS